MSGIQNLKINSPFIFRFRSFALRFRNYIPCFSSESVFMVNEPDIIFAIRRLIFTKIFAVSNCILFILNVFNCFAIPVLINVFRTFLLLLIQVIIIYCLSDCRRNRTLWQGEFTASVIV